MWSSPECRRNPHRQSWSLDEEAEWTEQSIIFLLFPVDKWKDQTVWGLGRKYEPYKDNEAGPENVRDFRFCSGFGPISFYMSP